MASSRQLITAAALTNFVAAHGPIRIFVPDGSHSQHAIAEGLSRLVSSLFDYANAPVELSDEAQRRLQLLFESGMNRRFWQRPTTSRGGLRRAALRAMKQKNLLAVLDSTGEISTFHIYAPVVPFV